MGTEYSIQHTGMHDDQEILATKLDQEILATKLERTVEVQPSQKSSPDVTQGSSNISLAENEVENHTTKLERTLETQLAGEALPDIAQGILKGSFAEEGGGQTDKQQNEAETSSLPNETKDAQALQESCQKGDTSPLVPEGVLDFVKEARQAKEVNTVHCCAGDTTEVMTVNHVPDLTSQEKNQHTGHVCELNIGGQPIEHNLTQQDLSTSQQKLATSEESHTVNKKLVCFLLNEEDFLTMNLNKASNDLNDFEAQHSWELAEVTTPHSTAKSLPKVTEQLQSCGVENPSSIDEVAKAVPNNEPPLEITKAQIADPDEERVPQKATQTVHTELEMTTVVTEQLAEMEATTQDQTSNDGIPDLLESAEKLTNAPEEEDKLQVFLLPEKKKLFCCTVL